MNRGTRGLSVLLALLLALTLAATAASGAGAAAAFTEERPQLDPKAEMLPDLSEEQEPTDEPDPAEETGAEQTEDPEPEQTEEAETEQTEKAEEEPAPEPTEAPAERTPANYTIPALAAVALALCAGVILALRKKKKDQSKQ